MLIYALLAITILGLFNAVKSRGEAPTPEEMAEAVRECTGQPDPNARVAAPTTSTLAGLFVGLFVVLVVWAVTR